MVELAQFLQAISVIFAAWAVIAGVDAWKREFIGKRRIEVAEQVLAKFYELKDTVAFIRSPWSSQEEGKSRKRAESESEVDADLLDRGYVVIERYEKKQETFAEFNALKYKFMASFGAESGQLFEDTNKAVNSVFASARMLATHYWRRQGRVPMEPDEFEKHLNEMHRHEGIFWDTQVENDEIRKKLAEIQARFDAITTPCVEELAKSYNWLTKPLFKKS
jgi:hypothetical protein